MRLDPLTPSATAANPAFHTPPPPQRTVWPDAVAYREAVQTPTVSLGEPGWKTATVAVNRQGLPVTYAGRFAVVFRATLQTGEKWALRCFTSPGADAKNGNGHAGVSRAMRYQLLAPHAARLPQLFVPFRYVERGINVGGSWYPVVAMQWATGTPLGQWIEKNLSAPDKLRRLCGVLSGVLAELEAAQMAHGDFQHDNLLISPTGDAVTLVDYDGLFVPELAGSPSPEGGHPNYQHPKRTPAHFGPGLDRFACLVLQTGLLALSHQPALWARFSDGESVLFQKSDFVDPSRSQVFHAVRAVAEESGDETLADSIARLEDACRSEAGETLLPGIAPVELPLPPMPVFAAAPLNQNGVQPTDGKSAVSDWWELQAASGQKGNGKSAVTAWWEMQAASGSGASAKSAGKWWEAGGVGASSFIGTKTAMTSASATGETFAFLERLYSKEIQTEEAKYALSARVSFLLYVVAVLFFVSFFLASKTSKGGGNLYWFSIISVMFVNAGSLSRSKWPRKKIHDELTAEITKMEGLAQARLDKVLHIYGGSKPVSASGGGATVGEYIADRLRQTNARAIVSDNRFQASTLRLLRESGIETVLDLQRRSHVPKVPPHTFHALQQWVRELESNFAAEYRKSGGAGTVASPQQTPQEAARLRDEAREFAREAARLKRERDLFPDVSFAAYWRKLIGLPDAAAKGRINVP